MPSENVDKYKYDGLFREGKTYSNRRRSGFLLLLERVNDGVNGIIEQASGFSTRGYKIRQSVAMA